MSLLHSFASYWNWHFYSLDNRVFIIRRFITTSYTPVHSTVNPSIISKEIRSYFSGSSSTLICCMRMSRCKLSPGFISNVRLGCQITKCYLYCCPLSNFQRSYFPSLLGRHIFLAPSSILYWLYLSFFVCGQLGGKPHSPGPQLSLRVACQYELLKAWSLTYSLFWAGHHVRGVI